MRVHLRVAFLSGGWIFFCRESTLRKNLGYTEVGFLSTLKVGLGRGWIRVHLAGNSELPSNRPECSITVDLVLRCRRFVVVHQSNACFLPFSCTMGSPESAVIVI